MRIENETKLTLEEMCEALSKNQPIKYRNFIILIISFILAGGGLLAFCIIKFDVLILICAIIALVSGVALGIVTLFYFYTNGYKGLMKANAKIGFKNGCSFKYVFKDEEFNVIYHNQKGSGNDTLKYSQIVSVRNYKSILFLFIPDGSCYIVDISKNNTDDASQIYRKFSHLIK